MLPVEISPLEARQFSLLLQRSGVNPASFKLHKLHSQNQYKVRVVGATAATVYDEDDEFAWMGRFANDLQHGLFGGSNDDGPLQVQSALEEIQVALARHGLLGAVEALNARVPHRFTAVYRLEHTMLHNVVVVDKHKHLDPLDLAVVPLKDSYCQFVLRDSLFVTQDSGVDPRLLGHPYAGTMKCYVGVPIRGRNGSLAGTLCHFDLDDQILADKEFVILDRTARLLADFVR